MTNVIISPIQICKYIRVELDPIASDGTDRFIGRAVG